MKIKFIKIIIFLIICILLIFLIRSCQHKENIIHDDPYINLYLSGEKRVIKLKLEDYIVGTVAAEMPASFEMEALKAQAVCARTYALRKIIDNHKYPLGADLADDINTCQAYISPEEFARRHPQQRQLINKISEAVHATQGEIMVYENQPIDALYHSTCGGCTESAANAWSADVPYLQSVACEYCKQSRYYSTVQVFSTSDIGKVTNSSKSAVDVKIAATTPSGRVKKILINNEDLSGEQFRRVLQLPSSWLKLQYDKDKLIINSRGYGHGVGMCQYGANGMAQKGKKYREILKYYYRDIQIKKLDY